MIDILLATYNGSEFIREQIESIQRQTFREWKLLVHDDGSTDGTMDIVRDLASGDSRIVLIEDGVTLKSPGRNFMHLLKCSEAPYIMFCDQDDIWREDKVERMFRAISSTDRTVPQVVYSNASVWTPEEGVKGPSTLYFATVLEDFLFLNSGVQGSSAIFNAKTRGMMLEYPESQNVAMHDHLLQLVCICFGNVSVIQDSLMLYREHAGQSTGKTKTRIFYFKSILSRIPVIDYAHLETVKVFRDCYSYALDGTTDSVLDDFISMEGQGLCARIRTVLRRGFTLYGSTAGLIAKIITRKFISL